MASPAEENAAVANTAIKNRVLFEKVLSLNFEVHPGLLAFVLEKKKIKVEDDLDTIATDLFLENFVRLAKKK